MPIIEQRPAKNDPYRSLANDQAQYPQPPDREVTVDQIYQCLTLWRALSRPAMARERLGILHLMSSLIGDLVAETASPANWSPGLDAHAPASPTVAARHDEVVELAGDLLLTLAKLQVELGSAIDAVSLETDTDDEMLQVLQQQETAVTKRLQALSWRFIGIRPRTTASLQSKARAAIVLLRDEPDCLEDQLARGLLQDVIGFQFEAGRGYRPG
jgi:hypothetical protein